jgi:membrane-bound serine protease (ClpP class)
MHQTLAFTAGLCLLIAVLLLFSAFQGASYYGITPQTQIALAILIFVVIAILLWMIFKAAKARASRIKTGKEALIGSVGVVVTDLSPKGEIRVLGEFWQAKTKGEPIESGKKVEVAAMDGMFLIVKATEEKA